MHEQSVEPQQARADARDFHTSGFHLIRNAFPADYIRQLYDAFVAGYAGYFENRIYDDATHVGDRRTMLTVALGGPFNVPLLYANPRLMPVLRLLLGEQIVLGGLGGVVSLPGARDQHIHRDHRGLFDEGEPAFPLMPAYAITVIVPLVPLTERNGTTRMFIGSHRVTTAEAHARPTSDPYTEPGDCILMDYRTLHGGLANNGDALRPILYVTYYREWFRDNHNYSKHVPLALTEEEYAKIDPGHRYLVDWLVRPRH